MVLQLGQNVTVFGRFLKFLLSNNPETNIDPHSTPQDSTVDTPQGEFWKTFFYLIQWAQGNFEAHARSRNKSYRQNIYQE